MSSTISTLVAKAEKLTGGPAAGAPPPVSYDILERSAGGMFPCAAFAVQMK